VDLSKPAPDASQSAWVKLCSKSDSGNPPKAVNVCLTTHERIDSNTGAVVVSAAVRQVEGNTNQHLMVTVPLSTLQSPDMALRIYPKDHWTAAYRNEKMDDSRLKLIWITSVCRGTGCTADTEATPELIAELKQAGGIVVLVRNNAGVQVALPIPLTGFEQAYAGAPVDKKVWAEARQKLMEQIQARQAEKQKGK
jgi:invasion protein IalB